MARLREDGRSGVKTVDYVSQYSSSSTTTTHQGALARNYIDFEVSRKLNPFKKNRFNVPLGIVEIKRSTPATRLLPDEVTKVYQSFNKNACLA